MAYEIKNSQGQSLGFIPDSLTEKVDYADVSASRALSVASDMSKVLNCTGTITLTLPSPNSSEGWVIVKNIGSGVVTLSPASGSVYFDGVSEDIELQPRDHIMLACQSSGHYTIVVDGRWYSRLYGYETALASYQTVLTNATDRITLLEQAVFPTQGGN